MDELDVIRLFPDYAGTTIWFPLPVPYSETSLAPQLILDLEEWERSYYAGLSDFVWRSAELHKQFIDDGLRLAERVAAEVGPEFTVRLIADDIQREFVSEIVAANTDAADAFRELASQSRAEHEEAKRRRGTSGSFGWFAQAPDGPRFIPRPGDDAPSGKE